MLTKYTILSTISAVYVVWGLQIYPSLLIQKDMTIGWLDKNKNGKRDKWW